MYEERKYREYMKAEGLVSFNTCICETDLQILAGTKLEEQSESAVLRFRSELTGYISRHPEFLTSLVPIAAAPDAPDIVLDMCRAAELANVGPMAAVAGAFSKYVGRQLLKYTDEVIVENGGDIYIKSSTDRRILIYAGSSVLSNKLALLIPGSNGEFGVCTSSGTVGHSLSFGKADAAVILSKDVVLADAAATAVGNVVKDSSFIDTGLKYAMSIKGVAGVVIIVGNKVGACGDVNLINP